jgi:hypothetical protein
MKMLLIVGCLLTTWAYAAPERIVDKTAVPEKTIQTQRDKSERAAIKAIKSSPEWVDLQADYASLTNKLNLRNVDYIAATNAVAGTTGTTKTALNKVINLIESDNKVDVALKKLIADLKQLHLSLVEAQSQ